MAGLLATEQSKAGGGEGECTELQPGGQPSSSWQCQVTQLDFVVAPYLILELLLFVGILEIFV